MNDSTVVGRAVLTTLCEAGLTDVVLAPGSRSAALALAVYDADRSGDLRLHVRVDERSAAFLALGLSKSSRRPVAVVTTSGTAAANLHPAVLEALHAGVALIVLTADRPASLRGTGANQTTEQHALFGPRVPSVDVSPGDVGTATHAVREAVRRRGPTQVNLQFAEPLLPDPDAEKLRFAELSPADSAAEKLRFAEPSPADPAAENLRSAEPFLADQERAETLEPGLRTVVVAGDDAGPPARLLAESANWPLLAEPTSGARTGTHALRTYRLLLETALSEQIERVVVTGHPTLSRPVTRLLSRTDVEVLAVRGRAGIVTDPGRVARHLDITPVAKTADDAEWLDTWRSADDAMARAIDELAATHADALPLLVAAEVAAAVGPGGLLVVGSSQPVRDLELMARPYPVGQHRLILGNRGLAGIDGMVSTAIGAALGRPSSSRALAYLGDVTFLHDAGGLVAGPHEPRPDLTLVVANDDGGSIFSTLEQGDPAYARQFERVFGTPHGVDLAALCAATRTVFERVADAGALRTVLSEESSGIRVIEIQVPRRGRRRLEADLRSLAAMAV
jgi:2-succinyl-5-enolpyruvyl-6-hydroxy-3-cyclohexene-1-carboxylate synthase